jgi:hypothetical protein
VQRGGMRRETGNELYAEKCIINSLVFMHCGIVYIKKSHLSICSASDIEMPLQGSLLALPSKISGIGLWRRLRLKRMRLHCLLLKGIVIGAAKT